MSNKERLNENNPNPVVDFRDDERLDALVEALASTLDDLDDRLDERRAALFIDTATGTDLEQIANTVGVRRETGESDSRLRSRTNANFGRATSTTTINDFASIASITLDADPSQFSIEAASGRPTILLLVDTSVLQDSLLSNSKLVELLSNTVPASHSVELQGLGSFRFDGDNYTPPANSGFGEGTFGIAETTS